jgi:hypothetical protein
MNRVRGINQDMDKFRVKGKDEGKEKIKIPHNSWLVRNL